MGLYKNFIDILRHTKDNKAFTTDEVVTALEQTVINENKINDEVLQRATDVSKLAQNITMVENNLSGRISNLNNALSSSINQVNNELSSRLNIVESDSYVTTNKIRNNAVVSTKIADGAVTTEKIASKSINASKIADHSIGSTQLDNLSINKNNLNLELQKEIGEISSLENNIFQFKNFDMTIECIFPSVIPPLEFRDGQEDEGEYISLMPSVPTIKINGVERYMSNDITYCSIPTSETSYIYYRYDAEYDTLSANYCLKSQEPKFEADGSWNFTAYVYDNIRLEFKVSSGSDYYVLETYSGDFDVTNVDISGTTPVAKLNHTFPTYLGELSDLNTQNKDCLVAAINENNDSLNTIKQEVNNLQTKDITTLQGIYGEQAKKVIEIKKNFSLSFVCSEYINSSPRSGTWTCSDLSALYDNIFINRNSLQHWSVGTTQDITSIEVSDSYLEDDYHRIIIHINLDPNDIDNCPLYGLMGSSAQEFVPSIEDPQVPYIVNVNETKIELCLGSICLPQNNVTVGGSEIIMNIPASEVPYQLEYKSLQDLNTQNKTSIVDAINENVERLSTLETTVGTANSTLSTLLSEGV